MNGEGRIQLQWCMLDSISIPFSPITCANKFDSTYLRRSIEGLEAYKVLILLFPLKPLILPSAGFSIPVFDTAAHRTGLLRTSFDQESPIRPALSPKYLSALQSFLAQSLKEIP